MCSIVQMEVLVGGTWMHKNMEPKNVLIFLSNILNTDNNNILTHRPTMKKANSAENLSLFALCP